MTAGIPGRKFTGLPEHLKITGRAVELLTADSRVLGIYLAGSFATGKPDRGSDIDLYIIVPDGIIGDVVRDHQDLISNVADPATVFPATHLGDPHQIIAFYKATFPIHVDLQYREISDLVPRQKDRNVVVLLDRDGALEDWKQKCRRAEDPTKLSAERLQYFEDRFWAWCWYMLSKIDRGELWEARDAIEYMRTNVLVPLACASAGLPNEGNRRLEQKLPPARLALLEKTAPLAHEREAYRHALRAGVHTYLDFFESASQGVGDAVRLVDRDYFLRFVG